MSFSYNQNAYLFILLQIPSNSLSLVAVSCYRKKVIVKMEVSEQVISVRLRNNFGMT